MVSRRVGYVDGFVLVVPQKNVGMYRTMARQGAKLWRKHGALEYKECMGDDIKAPFGLPFPKLTKLKRGETVWFSFIGYRSKSHRDSVNKKVMADPAMNDKSWEKKMPFDMKRMAYGGFKVVVD